MFRDFNWWFLVNKIIDSWAWALLTPALLLIDRKFGLKEQNMWRLVLLFLLLSIPFILAHTYLSGLLLYPIPQISWSPLRNSAYVKYYMEGSWIVYCATAGLLLALRFYNRSLTDQLQLERVERSLVESRLSALRVHLELQKELAHANRLATMGQLTASISHEIRQPLATVQVRVDAAKRWLEQANLGEVREALEAIAKATARAGDIMTGVHGLAKKEDTHLDDFDMNEAVREVVLLADGEAKTSNVGVHTELAAGLPRVHGHRIRLQQVILNLVINAIQAIGASGEGPREVLIRTHPAEKDSISVAVQDTGPGMDQEQVERAFETFYTTKATGLGMGLSICRSIIEAHEGTIAITPNHPRGLTVSFVVPANAVEGGDRRSRAKHRTGLAPSSD